MSHFVVAIITYKKLIIFTFIPTNITNISKQSILYVINTTLLFLGPYPLFFYNFASVSYLINAQTWNFTQRTKIRNLCPVFNTLIAKLVFALGQFSCILNLFKTYHTVLDVYFFWLFDFVD